MLSSVSPGLELRHMLVRLLRSIFSDGHEPDAESGFLHKMQNKTGATADGHGHAFLPVLHCGPCGCALGWMHIEQPNAWC